MRHSSSALDSPARPDRTAALSRDLARAQRLARLLDAAVRIPVLGVRVGLDSLLGLLPGAGDALGALLSAYPILLALRHRLPGSILARMLGNVALDALVGALPLLGDAFDIGFKANVRNAHLFEEFSNAPLTTQRSSRRVVALAAAGVVAVLALLVAGAVWLLGALLGAVT